MEAVLAELHVYPLKSAGGTALSHAELTPTGLRHDREFMLVTPEGRHLSQREHPRMALLRPSFDGEVLTVSAPGMEPLELKASAAGEPVDVTVHRKPCQGVDQGDAAAEWFTRYLASSGPERGGPFAGCRLVRFTGRRPTGRGGGEVAFADGYPLLVISAESLADLNTRLDEPLPMDRFRPSLVLTGLGPYGEDGVRLLRVGETVVELVKPCARCVITTTDQRTAARTHEPLRTLATYRKRDGGLVFGQNAVPRELGTLRTGDPVEILERA
ncbi:MOSC domain-containing protein [Actinomadura logoneensis]|uniref:MOSC domain-containing protein n=1 Tax=Actinomadura logoneensis TaxID=2293572 RepID=A0A372JL47_9ACTN|nr:MOSC N-terminal beta barrel domain-containing protein [Actinomadura logoneensis]RFU40752.1 MOSC domain-containing protein [Actinomadura logoneensis]